jgi:putative flippase GtrA
MKLAFAVPMLRERQQYLRYAAVSLLCLCADFASFLLLLNAGIAAGMAAASGYMAGMVAHWLLSSRLVFRDKVATASGRRLRQQLSFLLSGLCGTALTASIVGAGTGLGLPPTSAKLIAIGASFQLVWLLRRRIVFA